MSGTVAGERRPRTYLLKVSAERGLLTIQQAQEQLECSRSHIYELGRTNKLELVKFGIRRMVTEQSMQRFLNGLEIERKVP
jgi:excisionase family DNA binding protein